MNQIEPWKEKLCSDQEILDKWIDGQKDRLTDRLITIGRKYWSLQNGSEDNYPGVLA